ncbi:MAG: hypothetical protein ACTICC_10670 [Lactiplantibacillus plantarum]
MLYTTGEMMAEIASHWSHDPNSVFYNLIDEGNQMFEFGSDLCRKMIDWYAIDYAEGTTLDMIAAQYQVYRPDSDDDFLRFLIRLKKEVAKSDGTINSIEKVISNSLEIDPKQIHVETTRDGNDNVNHITVYGIPFEYADDKRKTEIMLTGLQAATMLGIWIDQVSFAIQTQSALYVGATTIQEETVYLSDDYILDIPTTAPLFIGATTLVEEVVHV